MCLCALLCTPSSVSYLLIYFFSLAWVHLLPSAKEWKHWIEFFQVGLDGLEIVGTYYLSLWMGVVHLVVNVCTNSENLILGDSSKYG
jgi:hypothetical protein